MAASQTIRNEIAEALSGNEIYANNHKRWQFLYESYMGGEDYRRGQHLTRYQLETDDEYNARLAVTPLENHCASVVSVYNSFLFKQPVLRDLGTLAGLPETQDFLKDADLEGRSFDAFMREVATWSEVFGAVWVMVSKPNVSAMTLAEEQALGVRPYVSILTPLVVTDWTWHRDISGRYQLSYLKYLEDVNGDVKTVKEWYTDRIRTRIVNEKDNLILEDYTEANGLGVIPAVIAYHSRSTVRGLGISAISDIADAQKFIYNSTSEVAQSIALDSHPSIVTTQTTDIGTGAGAVIRLPENLDPNLKPYVLDFAGASISNIYESIRHTIDSIEKMACIGGVRATESRTLSGVALEVEFGLLNAKLSMIADNLELAEEQIWRLFCQYQGRPYDGTIHYPNNFNVRDNMRELSELEKARALTTDPQLLSEINARIADILEVENYVREQSDTTDSED